MRSCRILDGCTHCSCAKTPVETQRMNENPNNLQIIKETSDPQRFSIAHKCIERVRIGCSQLNRRCERSLRGNAKHFSVISESCIGGAGRGSTVGANATADRSQRRAEGIHRHAKPGGGGPLGADGRVKRRRTGDRSHSCGPASRRDMTG